MEVTEVTGRWTGRGLSLIGRVRSVFSVCACFSFLIERSGASSHDRLDTSGRWGSLLDSNRTLALWRPVSSAACPVTGSLERGLGLTARPICYGTSASGHALRVRSARPARPISATSAVSSA
jgi:hypothetical protein